LGLDGFKAHTRPVRLAYQPPASSTFFSQNKPASSALLSEQTSASQPNRLTELTFLRAVSFACNFGVLLVKISNYYLLFIEATRRELVISLT
jgi:hypothetical protein